MKYHSISLLIIVLFTFSFCESNHAQLNNNDQVVKINGMTLESPPRAIQDSMFIPIVDIHANFVSIVPYAFTPKDSPTVTYNHDRQWWGEREEGVKELARMAHANKMKVMLKPQVWVHRGWVGDFDLDTDADWNHWQAAYKDYILFYARIAAESGVELFCIGTEYKLVASKRPEYWVSLIKEVREIYSGKITYAANWDEYELITFWDQLDYIGVNAYFPLSMVATPTQNVLETAWKKLTPRLESLNAKFQKPILFTEYGYRSVDFSAGNQWELDDKGINLEAQKIAFKSFYETIWLEKWVAGGFIWKWEFDSNAGGVENVKYTPQGKPSLHIISKAYRQR